MSFGTNLQYLRRLSVMTQEALAEKLQLSRQTVSKWESDSAQPDINKAIELCKLFSCSLDRLFREDMAVSDGSYSDLRVVSIPAFRYVPYTVISPDPETDALERMRSLGKSYGDENPRLIGWDFPKLSVEQTNVYHLHGYTAAWVVPENIEPENEQVISQKEQRYAVIHIHDPFSDPFVIIPGAYRTLMDYMRLNGLEHTEKDCIPCFETDGENMDVYIACL